VQKLAFPWPEVRAKHIPTGMSLEEIKAWRTREAGAGRPSSYEDFCRAHGVCATCLGEGVTHNDNGIGYKVVAMEGDTQLFERCPVCDGTGKQPQP
jgi:DnaJ-class molecular chaperone